MSEQKNYYWQIDDFHEKENHLWEQLANLEWDGSGDEPDALSNKARISRVANQLTVRFFRASSTGQPFTRILLQEKVLVAGELVRTTEWIVTEAVVDSAAQRDRRPGEADWSGKPYIDDLMLTFRDVQVKE